MRMVYVLATLAFVMSAIPASGQAWSKWLRVEAPDGRFSAETPCTAGEISLFGTRPADINIGVPMEPAQRVLCLKGEIIFIAGIVNDPGFAQLEISAFDWIRSETLALEGRKGEARDGTIDEKRAFMNREARDGATSEIGYVEIDKTTVIMFLVGGTFEKGGQAEAAIDRFTQSIKVAAQ